MKRQDFSTTISVNQSPQQQSSRVSTQASSRKRWPLNEISASR
jgi:hypothetical protein